jgi:hypothetical protein
MTEFTIVTPADAGYFALLQALLSSLSLLGNVPFCALRKRCANCPNRTSQRAMIRNL